MEIRDIFSSLLNQQTGMPNLGRKDSCFCYNCNKTKIVDGFPYVLNHMIVCPHCGNKRCPKANNHRNACTNSNDVGQKGSSWEHVRRRVEDDDDIQDYKKPWVGLTDEERNQLWRDVIKWGDPSHDDVDLMKAIEAKLKEKNT